MTSDILLYLQGQLFFIVFFLIVKSCQQIIRVSYNYPPCHIFIYYSISQICNNLHCTKNSARSVIYELEQTGLIKKEYQQNGLPLKIYVNDIRNIGNDTYHSAPETPQNKPYEKLTNSSFNRRKTVTNDFSQKVKPVSFDVDLERKMEYKNLMTFAQKTKKRRTRNTGPTI